MCAEAYRGQKVLPVSFNRIIVLLRYVIESLTKIMELSLDTEKLDKDFLFSVLKQTVSTMDIAERQQLCGYCCQIVRAARVKEVERNIEDLYPLVMIAKNISKICVLSRNEKQSEKEQNVFGDGPHHVPP